MDTGSKQTLGVHRGSVSNRDTGGNNKGESGGRGKGERTQTQMTNCK